MITRVEYRPFHLEISVERLSNLKVEVLQTSQSAQGLPRWSRHVVRLQIENPQGKQVLEAPVLEIIGQPIPRKV